MDSQPSPIERLYPDPSQGPYRLRLWVSSVAGRPSVVGVEMWGVEPQMRAWHDPHIRATARTAQDDPSVFGSDRPDFEGPETAITASAIRLPLGAFLDGWVRTNQALGRATLKYGAGARHRVAEYLMQFGEAKRVGRPPLPDEVLILVAHIYKDAEAAGDRAPAKAVERELQKRLGYRKSKGAATVRSWIRLARKREYLPPPRRTKQ